MSVAWSWSCQVLRALRTLCRHWLPGQAYDETPSEHPANASGGASQRTPEAHLSQAMLPLPSFEDVMALDGVGLNFRGLQGLSPFAVDSQSGQRDWKA